MITGSFELFALLAMVTGIAFWIGGQPQFKKFFRILPPIVWVYLIPSILTVTGVIPSSHDLYGFVSFYFLPFALFLLTISVDLKAILKLGPMALAMLLVGTTGIVFGTAASYLIFKAWLPPDGWQALASLTGTWIGGTANMVAIQQSLEAPASILGPIVIVDSVVGYSWLAILIMLAAFQEKFDAKIGAKREVIDALGEQMKNYEQHRVPTTLAKLAMIVGLGLAAAVISRNASLWLPALGDPVIISHSTWAMLIVVTGGLVLSFTPMRKLEYAGASTVGYYALYLLVASIGAQANLSSILEFPAFVAAGITIIVIHAGLLFLAAWILKAPLFFVATGSMANVGGAASAPIVASVYMPALAPVGLLMAIAGYILGIYAALGAAKLLSILAFL